MCRTLNDTRHVNDTRHATGASVHAVLCSTSAVYYSIEHTQIVTYSNCNNYCIWENCIQSGVAWH